MTKVRIDPKKLSKSRQSKNFLLGRLDDELENKLPNEFKGQQIRLQFAFKYNFK